MCRDLHRSSTALLPAAPRGLAPSHEHTSLGAGRAIDLGLPDCRAPVHRLGVTRDTGEQQPLGPYVTGMFASPVVDLKDAGDDAGSPSACGARTRDWPGRP
ncbi:hypothetical protein [Streptomyces europaeiscabiei]|uniref:hypothetical protein n=1 Tax=Streptomyces europaeiscabiei TaxID=146819 RepID=UPI002E27731D